MNSNIIQIIIFTFVNILEIYHTNYKNQINLTKLEEIFIFKIRRISIAFRFFYQNLSLIYA